VSIGEELNGMKSFQIVLLLCFLIVVNGLSQFPDSLEIAVIIRDFQPSHPDFENFDSRRPFTSPPQVVQCGQLPGDTLIVKQGNLDFAQRVYNVAPRTDLLNQPMLYGPYDDPTLDNLSLQHNTSASSVAWSEHVTVSRGMVSPYLAGYQPDLSPQSMLTLIPTKAMQRCDNTYFEQWFSDVPGVNFRIETNLVLKKDPATASSSAPWYFIDSDSAGGFFPLDRPEYYSSIGINNWGPQNLLLWCPPPYMRAESMDYQRDQQNPNLCNEFWMSYDVSTGSSAVVMGSPRARNYNFTMMGYTRFNYFGGEKFTFTGDDDMWIFIDGILVADLGGVHAPAQVILDMDAISELFEASTGNNWEMNSFHDLHFYYAERQTDRSNLQIYTTLNDMVHSIHSGPELLEAGRVVENTRSMFISSNVLLNLQTIDWINAGAFGPSSGNTNGGPFILRSQIGGVSHEKPFVVTRIELKSATRDGYTYQVFFDDVNGSVPVEGDRISFTPYNPQLDGEIPRIMSELGKPIKEPNYAKVKVLGWHVSSVDPKVMGGTNSTLESSRVLADPENGMVYILGPEGQKLDLNGRLLE